MATNNVLYTAKVHTRGGRDGTATSDDHHLEVKLSSPGGAGSGTNPEQLLAAGWSACFLSAMKIVAAKMKIDLPAETAADTEVALAKRDGGFVLSARLSIHAPGLQREIAEAVVVGAHETCPYSKATRGNIDVIISVI